MVVTREENVDPTPVLNILLMNPARENIHGAVVAGELVEGFFIGN